MLLATTCAILVGIALACAMALSVSYVQYVRQRMYNCPKPEPSSVWPLGNYMELSRRYRNNVYVWLRQLHETYDAGDGVWRVFLGPHPIYVVSDRTLVLKMFQSTLAKDGYDYIRGEQFDVIRQAFGSNNVATLEDEAYQEKRTYIHSAFAPNTVRTYDSTIWKMCMQHIDAWISSCRCQHLHNISNDATTTTATTSNSSITVNMSDVAKQLACDVTGAIFIAQPNTSVRIQSAARQLGRMIQALSQTLLTPFSKTTDIAYEWLCHVAWPRGWMCPFLPSALQPHIWQQRRHARIAYYSELREFLNTVLSEIGYDPLCNVTAETTHRQYGAFFSTILSRYHGRITWDALTHQYVCPPEMETDIGALFFAGQDTTSALIMWFLVEACSSLSRQNGLYTRLQRAADDIMQTFTTQPPTHEDTAPVWSYHYERTTQGRFILACIYETLRLHSPALGTFRNVRISKHHNDPVRLGPYILEHGDTVIVYNEAMHGCIQHWGMDAGTWNPDRMMSYYELRNRWPSEDPSYAAFNAFIEGKHKCPGRRISIPEVAYFVTALFHHFEVTLHNEETMNITPRLEIVIIPTDPVQCVLTPRRG